MRSHRRVRLQNKPKPSNYTESCEINVAGRWRERNVWYPGRSAWNASKEVNAVQGNEAALSMQKSAEAIVAEKRRAKSIGVISTTEKGGMRTWMQKTSAMMAAHKEIVRNTKGM
jgi:hypothetical protein